MNAENRFENFDMFPALQALRPYAMAISFFALIVSIIYTVRFNIGQTNSTEFITLFGIDIYYSQWLLAVTGMLQDSSEVLMFLFGFWVLSTPGKKPWLINVLAWAAVLTSLSLILWSIASTWGGNNAMIDASVAASNHEKQKVQLIQQTIQTNQTAVESMNRNAAAIRIQAAEYGDRFISRSIDKIKDAQDISQQAASLAQNSLAAMEKLDQIDEEKLTQSNSALAAFERIGEFTGHDTNTVGTTFLLTRATQLELIGIITGLFCIFVPASARGPGLWSRFKDNFVQGANKTFDGMAERTGRGAAEIAGAGAPGSRFKPAANHPDVSPQNPPNPHPDAAADDSNIHPDDLVTLEPIADPATFIVLHDYVTHRRFDEMFIAIATGQAACSQNVVKTKFHIGGCGPKWIMVLLEAWDIASEPDANQRRKHVRKLTKSEARQELHELKIQLLGKEYTHV